MNYDIQVGNNIDLLRLLEDNSVDSIVTDPPYGIEFLGKDWDKDTGAMETWEECLRVLKPGGHLLAFSAARTYHQLASNVESVGFEIRDMINWVYGSGFPKAQDMGKAIEAKKKTGKCSPKALRETRMGDNYEAHPLAGTEGFGTKGGIFQFDTDARKQCEDGNKRQAFNEEVKDIENLTHIKGNKYKHSDGYEVVKLPDTRGDKAAIQADTQTDWKDVYMKVQEVNNEWSGWKTMLKPAHEPIVMARKPFKGSCVDNVLKNGTGALNIDGSRVKFADSEDAKVYEANGGDRPCRDALAGQTLDMFEGSTGFKVRPNSKPAHEPIVMARKPFKGSCVDNVLKHGTGALNIDATRVPLEQDDKETNHERSGGHLWKDMYKDGNEFEGKVDERTDVRLEYDPQGRFPSNVIGEFPGEHYQKYFYCPKVNRKERHIGMTPAPADNYDTGGFRGLGNLDKDGNKQDNVNFFNKDSGANYMKHKYGDENSESIIEKDPRAAFARIDGLAGDDHYINGVKVDKNGIPYNNPDQDTNGINRINAWENGGMNYTGKDQPFTQGNNHPTVKPVALMSYLVKLVTPPGGLVVDPFCGSGATGMAAVELGHTFIGMDLDERYCEISRRRIEGWNNREAD